MKRQPTVTASRHIERARLAIAGERARTDNVRRRAVLAGAVEALELARLAVLNIDVFDQDNIAVQSPRHEWTAEGCSCGQDTVTCQGCGRLVCGDVAVRGRVIGRDNLGNVGPCCFAKLDRTTQEATR